MVEAFLEKYAEATMETGVNGRNALHYIMHATIPIQALI
jgi:hypothetical protein